MCPHCGHSSHYRVSNLHMSLHFEVLRLVLLISSARVRGITPAQSDDFSIRKFSKTKASISLLEKV
jgi:hypothetical protein